MSILAYNCPHCRTSKSGFNPKHHVNFRGDASKPLTFYTCGSCGKPLVVLYKATGHNWDPKICPGDPRNHDFIINETWPKQIDLVAPKFTPENIAKFYLQGLDNLERQHFDAAGAMFRKTLDCATKLINPELKSDLNKRIKLLSENGLITKDMGEWAHQIRLGGNEAVHEDEPFSGKDAEDLEAFTKLFLMYAFTLPGMMKERKNLSGNS
ncbi:DUF4145 domain-containing protein [Azospirillum formosense]|uniref:DUF4145 domain-containing protein n=1 Tax=Azospirillum formosense TaxID=861533 RepID=A0ABX2L3A4_9PROT|nr:DUF4145 domain-containing protein [Azospirillum formosense]MBY3754083.1 DUF4145 domain-containing protein [Azospirillum formosense]NUB19680.1 DUF4145 domain-containing protein [Azospirillum formosense]